MIKHPEVCGINSHFHFIDELLVVGVDGLHGSCICPVVQEQVGFGDGFTLQIVEECIAPGAFAYPVNKYHAYQKNGSSDSGVF